jgi:WD40 repeat protein
VRFLRASNGDYLRTLESRSVVTSFSFSLDGTMLAAGTSDGSIQLWRVTDGTLLRTMAGHAGGVNSVAFSPDGETLASGAQDHTARLWRVQDGTPLHTIDTLAIVNSVAFSPDGKLLALGLEDGTIHLWGVWP